MSTARLTFFIGLVFIFLQVGCSKKAVPVSGSAGLSDGESPQAMEDMPNALGGDAVREQDTITGFFDDGPKGMDTLGEGSSQGRESRDDNLLRDQAEKSRADAEVVKRLLDIYFEYDKSILHKTSKEALQENARKLILHPNTQVQIEGHTDARGNNEYNLALGARRARAVKRFLEALGVEASRMKIISFGEEKPACRVSAERCWKQNRRAHFVTHPEG